jgi:hypothetical protein
VARVEHSFRNNQLVHGLDLIGGNSGEIQKLNFLGKLGC